MPQQSEADALLVTCGHDLALATRAFGDVLGELQPALTDAELTATVTQLTSLMANQAAALADGLRPDQPPNLWMPGITADARRDVQTQEDPWSRDIALIGAVRKGVAALIVSLETARVVAAGAQDNMAAQLGFNQRELAHVDGLLASHLDRLGQC